MGQTTEQSEPEPTGQSASGDEAVGGPILLLPSAARYAGGAGPGGREGLHVVAANNRFARVVLTFPGLRPGAAACLQLGLGCDRADPAGLSPDWAAAGFDFLAADGSSLDLDHVPGLVRSLLDPHVAWMPGPALQGSEPGPRIAFRVPDQARAVAVTLRSWRNGRPFTVSDPALVLGALEPETSARRRLDAGPFRLRYGLAEDIALVLRGQIYAERPDEHAARGRLVYRDAAGAEIAPPYSGCVSVPGLGAVINLAAQPQARRFTLTLRPPSGAVAVELDFAPWEDAEVPPAVELTAAPEIALEDDFRLESLCGDDLLDAPAFVARLAERLGSPDAAAAAWLEPAEGESLPLLARIRGLRAGPDRSARLDEAGRAVVTLAGLPDWTLPEPADMRADPFRSVAWRLAYQSLSWLLPLAGLPGGLARARALALAWSEANPWGHPADPLGLHPAALGPRADVLAGLLAGDPGDPQRGRIAAEAVRHGFALAEIVGQNALARTLHGIQVAAALLGLARALPRLPFADHWDSLARESLREGFAFLLGAEGRFAESAPVRRLDLVGHGQAIAAALGAQAPGPEIGARAAAALPGLAGLLDATGRLPPFGDAPAGLDHAAWIRRLGGHGTRDLVAERDAPPEAGAASADIVSLRYDGPERGWGYFACLAAAQSPAGHRDCTSFVFAADGRRWIVEGEGSEGIEAGAARLYLLSPRAHNVAIPDGREPVAGHGRITERQSLDGAEILTLATNVHGPDYAHVRIFAVLDDLRGLAAIDRFTRLGAEEGQALSFEGLLHLAPDSLVALSGPRRALAQQEGRRIEFLPWTVTGQAAGLDVVVGRNDRPGTMHGFVATGTGGLKAAPVLRYAFSGRGTVCGGIVIAADAEAETRLVRLLAGEPVRSLTEGGDPGS